MYFTILRRVGNTDLIYMTHLSFSDAEHGLLGNPRFNKTKLPCTTGKLWDLFCLVLWMQLLIDDLKIDLSEDTATVCFFNSCFSQKFGTTS